MADLVQKTILILEPGDDIVQMVWSVPGWEALGDPSNDANKGMVRHGGVDKVMDYVPPAYKPSYPSHVQVYLDTQSDPQGEKPRSLLVWGTRNTFQNLGLPGYHAMRRPQLLRRFDEPWQHWVYHALCKFTDGTLGIAAVKFACRAGSGEPDSVIFVNKDRERRTEVEWAVTGQPLLWDGEVPPPAMLAACTYDQKIRSRGPPQKKRHRLSLGR